MAVLAVIFVVVPAVSVATRTAVISSSIEGVGDGVCATATLAAWERASIAGALIGMLIGAPADATGTAGFVATESVQAPRLTPRIKTSTVPMNFVRNIGI